LVLPAQPPQLLALLGREAVALARVHRRLPDPVAHGRLTQVELAADRGQRPLAPAHQGDDLGLELRRKRPSLPPACPVPLHLLPHTDSLLVGSRPLLRCPPVRGKSTFLNRQSGGPGGSGSTMSNNRKSALAWRDGSGVG